LVEFCECRWQISPVEELFSARDVLRDRLAKVVVRRNLRDVWRF
jgi:hypothetical protein